MKRYPPNVSPSQTPLPNHCRPPADSWNQAFEDLEPYHTQYAPESPSQNNNNNNHVKSQRKRGHGFNDDEIGMYIYLYICYYFNI